LNLRRGQVLDQSNSRHYGIMYADILKAVRAQIPPSVEFVVARALDIETGPDRQRIILNNDDIVESRLVVLATGMSDVLRQKLGIKRRIVFENQCLSFGFSISPGEGDRFDFPALTYYGEELADRIDYLNIFPIGDVMRGNLFTFRDHRDPWIREMRRDPKATLLGIMPGLSRFLGDFQVVDKVQNWLMDLYVVENYRRDGVVLIGDSFQTSCPAAGTGVSRLLTDVDRLCNVHLPHWFKTPGMTASKLAQAVICRSTHRRSTGANPSTSAIPTSRSKAPLAFCFIKSGFLASLFWLHLDGSRPNCGGSIAAQEIGSTQPVRWA
jgi:2-polyprenyl-6-methoxyphenol hydroxylase-like FAD-dependent oxidoreductase